MAYFSFIPFISLNIGVFLASCSVSAEGFGLNSSTVYGGTTWINNFESSDFLIQFKDPDALVRPILLTSNISFNDVYLHFGCGFFCYGSPCDTGYLFATFFVMYDINGNLKDLQMVWSSNRDDMVHENATLILTSTGELLLRDTDGSLVWSTMTSNPDFQGMAIRESGNLVLFSTSNSTIWESFDHPTDTVLLRQKFKVGQKLISNISPTNTSKGILCCSMSSESFSMFTIMEPYQIYYRYPHGPHNGKFSYVLFDTEYLHFYYEGGFSTNNLTVPQSSLYFRITSDGHLQFYSFLEGSGRSVIDYVTDFTGELNFCQYPTSCGSYGVCTEGQCSCPKEGDAFYHVDTTKPNLGCIPNRPVVCSDSSINNNRASDSQLLELEHVSYFAYTNSNGSLPQLVSRDYCQKICLTNCSCKAAFFRYGENFSRGFCYLVSSVFSVQMNNQTDEFYNSTAYIKVHLRPKKNKKFVLVALLSAIGGVFMLFLLLSLWLRKYRKVKQEKEEDEDQSIDLPAGLPFRYSFQELQIATNDFSVKLGSGGFGSVYEGVLSDGSKIAVKILEKTGQGKKEFRAEVETLGNVDHLNLVKLKGFCAEKSHRMLVYEHLPNGSLDKWIFPNKRHKYMMDWKTRYNVVLDIARGLTYLHEECREQIIHFDVKPQNILLDQNFNAKISDFGLAKLVNREESEVITLMRGTPGYMAPELLNMHFTEKADIFSFGVMLLEIVSAKKSRELSENGLFSILQVKAEERRLIDLVYEELDENETDIREQAIKMIKVAMWCVQEDFTRRPAMSTVVKALEGLIDRLDQVPCAGFTVPSNHSYNREVSYTPPPSVLSLPR